MHLWRPLSTFCFLAIGCLVASTNVAAIQPANSLTVSENFQDPIGFYDPSPVFSWKLPVAEGIKAQTAYQIVVTSPSDDAQPIWDSGKVASNQSLWVPYQGPKLQSRQCVDWKIRYWDDQNRQSDWSDSASIEMGLLDNRDWDAKWIEPKLDPAELPDVKILKAEFGNRDAGGSKVVDVSGKLQDAIDRGATPLRVNTHRLGGDPAPGQTKTLWVDLEVGGVRKQVEINLNKMFDPYPPITADPASYLRREFSDTRDVVHARLYASALGIYQFQINGRRVGDDMLSPGYTTYSKRVESLTYDVTDLLQKGDNAIGAVLCEGWYAGNLILRKRSELLQKTPKLLAQLEITYADGQTKRITTDDQWRATNQGPIRRGGLYHGEDYDANKELGAWTEPGFNDDQWLAVRTSSLDQSGPIVPKRMPPVQVMRRVEAVGLTEIEPGTYIFDFGQNLVGVPTITMPVTKGEKVTIRFAEMLQQDGTLYTKNYRSARSKATYLAAQTGVVSYQPASTFFGYRYLEISGLADGDQLTTDSVTANVLHTKFDSRGTFTSSHPKLNQLQSNIRWGQISNFIDVPTDCPQRDERLGWTGDAQVFLPTSFFNFDVYSFWAKWLQSVRDDQNEEGEIPHTVPQTNFGFSSPGWADVIVTAPWDIYQRTGDKRILLDNYEAMKKWLAVYQRRSENLIPTLTGFGDWLQPYPESDRKGDTAQSLIATAYFGRDARILHWAALAIGNQEDADKYAALHKDIQSAFTKTFFPEGQPHPGAQTQTACLMALGYDLVLPERRSDVASLLLEKFEEADRHLRTGFLGTPLLAPVFDDLGHPEICYELLFKETYPSWFFSINQGATTMWERWNSYSHADGFGDASMNSYNHYAYGAIGQFMYERVAGLSPDPNSPGYKHFFVRPLLGGPLEFAKAELETGYGTAVSGWATKGDMIEMEIVVPPNTTATVQFPGDRDDKTLLAGKHKFVFPR